jgi:drug/metabolite transporter (DMT)-like permease
MVPQPPGQLHHDQRSEVGRDPQGSRCRVEADHIGPVPRGIARCLLAAALFGASAPAASKLADGMPALVLAGLLYVGAGLAVVPAVLWSPPSRVAVVGEWRRLGLAVVLGGGVGPVLLIAGLSRTPAATASILLNLELVATVALAAIVFHEHLGARLIAGTAMITLGGAVLVWQPSAKPSLGALCIVGACIAWAIDNSVTARLDQLSPAHIVVTKGAVAGLANLSLGLAIAGGTGLPDPLNVIAALGLGAIGYGLSITLWVSGARELGAARGQVVFATGPFIGAGIAWLFLAEPVTTNQLAATTIAATGVGISLQTRHEHQHHHEPTAHYHEHLHDDSHHHHTHQELSIGRHTHRHHHTPADHSHPHVPDLHHQHSHN